MPPHPSSESREQRRRSRILNACDRCRKKKIRCTGSRPCQTCTEHDEECVFPVAEKKIMVSEGYLRDLIARTKEHDTQLVPSPAGPSRTIASDPAPSDPARIFTPATSSPIEEVVPAVRNPLTSSDTFFYIDSSLKQRYLGSSSSLSFSWQVRSFLQSYVGAQVPINLVPVSEEETYSMASSSVRGSLPLLDPASDLPPYQYAKYLAETTFFHLGDIFHIGDRAAVATELAGMYRLGYEKRPLFSLGQVYCLLIIAFGKLFLRRGASSFGPPGAKEFLWALKLLSDPLNMWNDSLQYLEVLCLTALYLNTADMRANAYTTIGQAMRIALTLGMNREPPSDLLGQADHYRRRRIWWTVYIIDRKLTVIMGAPLSIGDEDIDITLPDEDDSTGLSGDALRMHIRLAKLEGQVMTTAYQIHSTVDKTFVQGLQQIFAQMGILAQSFTAGLSLNLDNSKTVSRTAATLHILYHQCIIISTRPLLFALVKHGMTTVSEERSISAAVSALINTCVGAATKIITILSALHEQDLCEAFLPMELQAAFSAPCVLLVTSIAYPSVAIDGQFIDKADSILSWMSNQGNAPANSRRRDLAELRAAAQAINVGRNQANTMAFTLPGPNDWLWDPTSNHVALPGASISMTPDLDLTSDTALWNQIIDELTRS